MTFRFVMVDGTTVDVEDDNAKEIDDFMLGIAERKWLIAGLDGRQAINMQNVVKVIKVIYKDVFGGYYT